MKKMIKKLAITLCTLVCGISLSAFESNSFKLSNLKKYQREYLSESVGVCSTSSTKTYEDYRMITATDSKQYKYIHNEMTVDETTGFLYDEDGFIGVAMGYQFGEIGSRYYIVLDTDIIIPVVKVDAKASVDAPNGCSHSADSSVIEFVIDADKAYEYFGGGNGYVCNGNLNNSEFFKGNIQDIEEVKDEKLEDGVVYEHTQADPIKDEETKDGVKFIEGGF